MIYFRFISDYFEAIYPPISRAPISRAPLFSYDIYTYIYTYIYMFIYIYIYMYMYILEASARFARASGPEPWWGPPLGSGGAFPWALMELSSGPWRGRSLERW